MAWTGATPAATIGARKRHLGRQPPPQMPGSLPVLALIPVSRHRMAICSRQLLEISIQRSHRGRREFISSIIRTPAPRPYGGDAPEPPCGSGRTGRNFVVGNQGRKRAASIEIGARFRRTSSSDRLHSVRPPESEKVIVKSAAEPPPAHRGSGSIAASQNRPDPPLLCVHGDAQSTRRGRAGWDQSAPFSTERSISLKMLRGPIERDGVGSQIDHVRAPPLCESSGR